MKHITFAFILFSLVCIASAAEEDVVYHLISDRSAADLDYKALDRFKRLEDHIGNWSIMPLFHPVPGRFRILTFCCLHDSFCMEDAHHFIGHYFLILKIDSKQRIVDGFYYMMEWQDSPESCLLRIHSNGRHLAKAMTLSSSDFRRLNGKKLEDDELFPISFPTAHLDNFLDFKKAF